MAGVHDLNQVLENFDGIHDRAMMAVKKTAA